MAESNFELSLFVRHLLCVSARWQNAQRGFCSEHAARIVASAFPTGREREPMARHRLEPECRDAWPLDVHISHRIDSSHISHRKRGRAATPNIGLFLPLAYLGLLFSHPDIRFRRFLGYSWWDLLHTPLCSDVASSCASSAYLFALGFPLDP